MKFPFKWDEDDNLLLEGEVIAYLSTVAGRRGYRGYYGIGYFLPGIKGVTELSELIKGKAIAKKEAERKVINWFNKMLRRV